MAIARGAGTEIVRTAMFEDVVGTTNAKLIIGVQHHIYTILSVVLYANAVNTAGTDYVALSVKGYDSYGGTSAQNMYFLQWKPSPQETFVWNDKFSFNGTEPTDFSATLGTDATKQDAIADQATTTSQDLEIYVSHASTQIDVYVTFIDQNNA